MQIDNIKKINNSLFHNDFFERIIDGLNYNNIIEISNKLQKILFQKVENEENCKMKIILPIMEQILGYDQETILAEDKKRNVMGSIDYTAEYENTLISIEAKDEKTFPDYFRIKKRDRSCPVFQIMDYINKLNTYLHQTKNTEIVSNYGILTNGYKRRLYHYHSNANNINQPPCVNFDLTEIDRTDPNSEIIVRLFIFFFSKKSLVKGGPIDRLFEENTKKSLEVRDNLKDQVFKAVELIGNGIYRKRESWKQDEEKKEKIKKIANNYAKTFPGYIPKPADQIQKDSNNKRFLKVLYHETLVYLFRVIFGLYAEDNNLFEELNLKYTLKSKGENVLDVILRKHGNIIGGDNSASYIHNEDILLNQHYFGPINERYNGGLFSNSKHSLLQDFDIEDSYFLQAIDYLMRTKVKDVEIPATINFQLLDVKHLGTIYENLLENIFMPNDGRFQNHTQNHTVNGVDSMSISDFPILLVNDKGERKSTGSYYTPDYIVKYIVEETVGPLLSNKNIEQILTLKICDPAMGSGHFLVEVVNFVYGKITEIIAQAPESEQPELLVKYTPSLVASKCIYGVDINYLAVELAKLVIWIKTFDPKVPLQFLDYNLQRGNSLIGTNKKDIMTFEIKGDTEFWTENAKTLYDKKISDCMNIISTKISQHLEGVSNDKGEVEKKYRLFDMLSKKLSSEILDLEPLCGDNLKIGNFKEKNKKQTEIMTELVEEFNAKYPGTFADRREWRDFIRLGIAYYNIKYLANISLGMSFLNIQNQTQNKQNFTEQNLALKGEASNNHYIAMTFTTKYSRIPEEEITKKRYNAIMENGTKPVLIYDTQEKDFEEKIKIIFDSFKIQAEKLGINILACNILPDHTHLLIFNNSGKEISEIVNKLKGFSAFEYNKKYKGTKLLEGEQNALWARGYGETFILDEKHLYNTIDYIKNNHIKHGEKRKLDINNEVYKEMNITQNLIQNLALKGEASQPSQPPKTFTQNVRENYAKRLAQMFGTTKQQTFDPTNCHIPTSNIEEGPNSITAGVDRVIQSLNPFHREIQFPTIFANGGFDAIVGNPPYVRADVDNIYYQNQRKMILGGGRYKTLFEKRDLYLAFLDLGFQLLKNKGKYGMIIPDSVCNVKYGQKFREMLCQEKQLLQIDYFPESEIFKGVGVKNIILFTENSLPYKETKKNIHEQDIEKVKSNENIDLKILGESGFKLNYQVINHENIALLGDICYVSKGMVLNADENIAKGEFEKDDLISDKKDNIHCREYVEAKNIKRYKVEKIRYLERGTERVPSKVSRKTFPELYLGEKIMRGRMTEGTFDDTDLITNDSIYILKRYCDLKGVNNLSIKNSISKRTDKKREELEKISEGFSLKYLLAIINSKRGIGILKSLSRSSIGIYPDDMKNLPIKQISLPDQQPFIAKADKMLEMNQELHNEINSFNSWLRATFQIEEKILKSKKISKFRELSWEEFYAGITKNHTVNGVASKGVRLGKDDFTLLQGEFVKTSQKIITLKDKVKKVDDEIDNMIFQLYKLNQEEIEIIKTGKNKNN